MLIHGAIKCHFPLGLGKKRRSDVHWSKYEPHWAVLTHRLKVSGTKAQGKLILSSLSPIFFLWWASRWLISVIDWGGIRDLSPMKASDLSHRPSKSKAKHALTNDHWVTSVLRFWAGCRTIVAEEDWWNIGWHLKVLISFADLFRWCHQSLGLAPHPMSSLIILYTQSFQLVATEKSLQRPQWMLSNLKWSASMPWSNAWWTKCRENWHKFGTHKDTWKTFSGSIQWLRVMLSTDERWQWCRFTPHSHGIHRNHSMKHISRCLFYPYSCGR